MGSITNPKYFFLYTLFLLSIQTKVLCYLHKVGDLDCWATPTSAKPYLYTNWTNNLVFTIGDSLFFLYPPSRDSVIQVTKQAYDSCNITDPILYMNNGNSLFNITQPGQFYFTSGGKGNCQNNQKLTISVPGNGSYSGNSPTDGQNSASAPSYPIVFGSIPMAPSSSPLASPSSSTPSISSPIKLVSAVTIGLLVCVFVHEMNLEVKK